MTTQMFVNLPVKDLGVTVEFFTKLGFTFNQKFTNENATCMIIGKDCFVMLLVEKFFKTFTNKEICDTKKSIETIVCLSFETRQNVDEIVSKAVAAGGRTYSQPTDHGFMYQHGFQDLDGHTWEVVYMDPSFINS